MGERGFWNLRDVMVEGKIKVREVHYDERGIPWSYCEARLRDKILFLWGWLRHAFVKINYGPGILRYPEDFKGEGAKITGPILRLEDL